jgi:tRNA(His) guanylyltransferase
MEELIPPTSTTVKEERTNHSEEGSSSDPTPGEDKKKADKLGDRFKQYEKQFEAYIDPTKPWIMRLDGHKFSSFTRKFKKPYDERISQAMIATAEDLLTTFHPTAAFTCSDEITLVWPAALPAESEIIEKETEEERARRETLAKRDPHTLLIYAGKVSKITSLAAGYASTCFNIHLRALHYDPETEAQLVQHLATSRPYFDARVHNVPNNVEVYNNVLWRSGYDYRRNSIAGLAQFHFPHQQLQGKNTTEMLQMLKEKGVDWNECPDWYKFGTCLKKESFSTEVTTPKGEKVQCRRNRIITRCINFTGFDENTLIWLLSKVVMAD